MGFELLAARLHGFVLNRPHSVEGKRHVKQLCDGLRRDIDGVVYAGDNQHIAEEHDSFIAQYLATLHSEGETPHNRCIISATIQGKERPCGERPMTLEYKSEVNRGFLKTVSAFANFNGGRIVFGVEDGGAVVGLDDPKQACLDIENRIRETLRVRIHR